MTRFDLRYRPGLNVPKKFGPLQQVEKEVFAQALRANGGVLIHVARVLGLNIITTRKRAKRYGLWPWKGQA